MDSAVTFEALLLTTATVSICEFTSPGVSPERVIGPSGWEKSEGPWPGAASLAD